MAGSLNKVILIGNLGADPEIREMPDGTKMAKFSIATPEIYKNRVIQLGENPKNVFNFGSLSLENIRNEIEFRNFFGTKKNS